jgi:hypothetical protein
MRAGEWGQLKMIGADMALKGLMFAESLVAWWISCASKPVVAFVRLSVPPQPRRRQEAFSTPIPVTLM